MNPQAFFSVAADTIKRETLFFQFLFQAGKNFSARSPLRRIPLHLSVPNLGEQLPAVKQWPSRNVLHLLFPKCIHFRCYFLNLTYPSSGWGWGCLKVSMKENDPDVKPPGRLLQGVGSVRKGFSLRFRAGPRKGVNGSVNTPREDARMSYWDC